MNKILTTAYLKSNLGNEYMKSNRYHSQPIKTGRYGILGEYLWHRNPIAW